MGRKPIEWYVVGGDCWICTSHYRDKDGYPRIRIGKKIVRMNRFFYEVRHGEKIPPGMVVRHTCDHPGCVNPDHLILGTPQDNMDDKVKSGHAAKKLSLPNVLKIFHDKTHTQQWLADKYGVSNQQISNIKNKKTWKHAKFEETQ